jgi:PST family polysaccharide transporter
LGQVVGNIIWQFADKAFRLGVGFAMSLVMARYLGPSDFGAFNYVSSIIAILSTVASLGLDSIVIRELVSNPKLHPQVLGTAFVLKFVVGLIVIPVAMVVIDFLRPDAPVLGKFVFVLSMGVPFLAFDVIDYWYQSLVCTKYVVLARNVVSIIMAGSRLLLVLLGLGLSCFVIGSLAELVLMGFALAFAYLARSSNVRWWTFSVVMAAKLIKDSWPLMLSAITIAVYGKVDQIMISEMLGDANVGIYSAAVRLVELWYVLPVLVASSLFPMLFRTRESNPELYIARMQIFLDFMVTASVIVAGSISFFSEPIVLIFYGGEYQEAVSVLRTYIWCLVFVCLLVATAQHLIAENKTMFAFFRNCFGMVVNIALNWLLIPRFGIDGAAYAALAGYVCSSMLVNCFDTDMRSILIMEIKALVFPFALWRLCEKF